LTEACDGEEEKSQESCEEKEDLDRKSLVDPPGRESAAEKAGLGTGRESCGETGSAVDGSGSMERLSRRVRPGQDLPRNPAAAWSFT